MSTLHSDPDNRLFLPAEAWPPPIKDAFDRAFESDGRPKRRSEGGHLPCEVTIRNYRESLARFMRYLSSDGLLRDDASLPEYLGDSIRKGYLGALLAAGLRDYSIHHHFEGLRAAARRMYPKQALPRIMRIDGVSISRLLPMERRDKEPPPLEEVIAWCKDLAEEGLASPYARKRRLLVRNGALFAVLASLGPRVSSAAIMKLGIHLRQKPGSAGWWLCFEEDEDKQKAHYEHQLDPWTWPLIERYLAVERSELLKDGSKNWLWLTPSGTPLGDGGISDAVRFHSRRRFGEAYGTHMFRRCIATDAMRKGGAAIAEAAARLGHRHWIMTTQYIHSSAVAQVGERHSQRIDAKTAAGECLADRLFQDYDAMVDEAAAGHRPSKRNARRRQLDLFEQ